MEASSHDHVCKDARVFREYVYIDVCHKYKECNSRLFFISRLHMPRIYYRDNLSVVCLHATLVIKLLLIQRFSAWWGTLDYKNGSYLNFSQNWPKLFTQSLHR